MTQDTLRLRVEIERQTSEAEKTIGRLTKQREGIDRAIARQKEIIAHNNGLLSGTPGTPIVAGIAPELAANLPAWATGKPPVAKPAVPSFGFNE